MNCIFSFAVGVAMGIVETEQDSILITVDFVDISKRIHAGSYGNKIRAHWMAETGPCLPIAHRFDKTVRLPLSTIINILNGKSKTVGTMRMVGGHNFVIRQSGRGKSAFCRGLKGRPENYSGNLRFLSCGQLIILADQ